MESTLNPNQTDPRDVLFARADEELAHAYEQIKRADEELARADDQFSKLERDAARRTSAKRGNRPSLVRGFTGLLMAACIGVAAIVWQSSYGDAAKQIIARWAPQSTMTSSLPLEKIGLHALPGPITVQAAAAEAAPSQPAPQAQTAPGDVAPTPAALPPGGKGPRTPQCFECDRSDPIKCEKGIGCCHKAAPYVRSYGLALVKSGAVRRPSGNSPGHAGDIGPDTERKWSPR